MSVLKPLVVRALELAGNFATNREIRDRLKQEGYARSEIDAHFIGRSFRLHLKSLRQKSSLKA